MFPQSSVILTDPFHVPPTSYVTDGSASLLNGGVAPSNDQSYLTDPTPPENVRKNDTVTGADSVPLGGSAYTSSIMIHVPAQGSELLDEEESPAEDELLEDDEEEEDGELLPLDELLLLLDEEDTGGNGTSITR